MEHEKLLKNLIEIKSYSGEEKDLRVFIYDWFKKRGIPVMRQGENLVTHLNGKDKTRAFILNSHMDTVSAGDAEWKYGAWTPTRDGDKLIGRGASDMKSGLTASMLLAEKMFNEGTPVDIQFTYVVREEEDGSGTENFANWFKSQGYLEEYKEIAAIFTEPTGLVEIEHGHRGNLFFSVEAIGAAGHSSRPDEVEGKLAVDKTFDFIKALRVSVKKWNKEFPNIYFKPAITLGAYTQLDGGNKVVDGKIRPQSVNKFPDKLTTSHDLRTTAEFHGLAYQKLQELASEMDVKVSMIYPAAPAGFTSPNEKIIQIAKKEIGSNAKLTVSQASADLGFLSVYGIKAIIFGPGEKDQAHQTDEYCYPDQIPQAVTIYQNIIESWAK